MQMNKGNDAQQSSKWTQQLHDKLADYETPVPPDLWADIEAGLPPDSGQRFQALQPRKASILPLRRWAAAAAVAIILVGGGLVWWSLDNRQAESLISMAEEPQYDAIQDEVEQGAAVPLPSRGGVAEGRGGVCNIPPVMKAQANSIEKKIQTPPRPSATPPLEGRGAAAHDDPPVGQHQYDAPSVGQSQSDDPPVSQHQYEETPTDETITVPLHRRSNRQPTIGLYAMNGFGSQDNSNAVMMADALAKNYTNTYTAGQATSRQAPIFLTGFEERQHHYQPLSFGLSVSYPLTERLSLTSGVVYTRLRSDFTQIIRSQQFTKEQTLHYVGVPVGLNYRLWRYKGFRAYLAAGMQADWNVKAQLNAEGVEQEMSRDRLQWSANGSLGLQYDVLPPLSLYAEPGINHYFDNGSNVQNFFKDKPTGLKLQFGVRFNLDK